eukprot:TRINITY_DN13471_c0_g2_i8.p1 TRINITY_DN13471_c0_g2~~TRINITY_DN13471_c0_g2_i8.p1  ORF type:complete len:182 (+),score=50.68 TRINITY_DN13471_c0_g2_i8:285-830(+)
MSRATTFSATPSLRFERDVQTTLETAMANDIDIAIIGVGLYGFGRHPEVSAIQMGVEAANKAMDDAGLSWRDVQVGYVGSLSVMMPETMTKFFGYTGMAMSKMFNGCATGGNLLLNTANAIRAGRGDIGICIGLDKHPKGAFSAGESMDSTALPQWYGDIGQIGRAVQQECRDRSRMPSSA